MQSRSGALAPATRASAARARTTAESAARARGAVADTLQRGAGNRAVGRLLAGAGIQRKLRVNERGDAFEQEADRVADRVMRTPAPLVQRTCACGGTCDDCAGDAAREEQQITPVDQVMRMPAAPPPGGVADDDAEDPDDALPVQRHARDAGPSSVNGGFEAELRGHAHRGEPLAPATRSFFEDRLGRDLGHVRIHTGATSARLNDEIHARAFTHRQHVWLGAGLDARPSHVLAHELVHVVQQTAPGGIGGQRGVPVSRNAAGPAVQRFAPYWEPGDFNGTRTHNEVLPEISRHAGIFVEAPVANADRRSAAFDKFGSADLYQASTTVGVYFSADQTAERLRSPRRLRFNGAPFPHITRAGPKRGPRGTVVDVDEAPTSIRVGDLKPSHGTIEALEGVAQVREYTRGFELAQGEVNEMAAAGRTSPPGQTWNLSTSIFTHAQLQALIPPQYAATGTGQTPRPLFLKQNGRAIRPYIRATGRLVLAPDADNAGILNYVWIPQPPPSVALPASVLALGEDVRLRILDPLRRPPRRGSLVETFDLGTWRSDRRRIGQQFRAAGRTSDVRDARKAAPIVEAHRAIEASTGLSVPEPSASTTSAARAMERVEFWTSAPAGAFGMFRRLFGRAFVRIYDGYERIRERFGNALRRRRAPGGGGLLGAAVKAAFSVLKMAASFVLRRTMGVLQESLVQGLGRKLASLIPEDDVAAFQAQLAQVTELRTRLEQQAIRSAEDIVARVLPGYEQQMERIQQVMDIVSGITRIVSLVRWGARAIACLSPPAIGCLWGLALSVLEELAALVVQSCWFQRRIAPLIASIPWLLELPRTLARHIIDAVRALLPPGLHDVFADVAASPPSADEIECDTSEGPGRPLTDEQRGILELQERIGEDRFVALMDLLRTSGAAEGTPLNRAMAERLGRAIEENGWSAADLHRFASMPRGRPVALEQFLAQLRAIPQRSPVAPVMPERPPVPDIDTEGSPEYSTVVVGPREGGGGETPPEPVRDEGGESETPESAPASGPRITSDVLEARARVAGPVQGQRVSGWSFAVARVHGALVEDGVVRIDMRMSRQEGSRRIVRIFRDLEVRVTEVAPSEQHPGVNEVFMDVTRDQQFSFPDGTRYGYREGSEIVHRVAAPAAAGR